MDPFLEIRKLPPSAVRSLGEILDYADQWKNLMGAIPMHLTTDTFEIHITKTNPPKYNSEHIQIIQQGAIQLQKSPTAILIDEWGTSGRIRANLGILAHLLQRANLYRAADYVSVELLGRSPVPRPQTGPAATVKLELRDVTKYKPAKVPDLGSLLRIIEDPEMAEDLVPARQRSLQSLLNSLEHPFSEAEATFYVHSDDESTPDVEESKEDVIPVNLAERKPKKKRSFTKRVIRFLNELLTKKDSSDSIVFSSSDGLSGDKNDNGKRKARKEHNLKDNVAVPHISLLLEGSKPSMEINQLLDAEAPCQCGGSTGGTTSLLKNNANDVRISNENCKCPNIPAFSKILTDPQFSKYRQKGIPDVRGSARSIETSRRHSL